ncbi:MAG: ADP-ribosylglycohydrolase family protein, partial [Clostridia bacterium]|nr:ADP-ribosylglycohydrolase family protein [Clostridia bacterium]
MKGKNLIYGQAQSAADRFGLFAFYVLATGCRSHGRLRDPCCAGQWNAYCPFVGIEKIEIQKPDEIPGLKVVPREFTSEKSDHLADRLKGGIYGVCCADAVGLPVQFENREERKKKPVTGMQGYGVFHQPPGTWSDDSSLTLCLLDSLSGGLDYHDIMVKFRRWLENGSYTPFQKAFDIGNSTYQSIKRFEHGMEPLQCGGKEERDNGNGSLMRILPLAFYLFPRYGADVVRSEPAMEAVHNVSALTHAHARSRIACGIDISIACRLINGDALREAVKTGISEAMNFYRRHAEFAAELTYFGRLSDETFNS